MKTLGYIWPKVTRCPECGSSHSTRATTWQRCQYRRCRDCGNRYKVLAIARHIDREGDQSEVETL